MVGSGAKPQRGRGQSPSRAHLLPSLFEAIRWTASRLGASPTRRCTIKQRVSQAVIDRRSVKDKQNTAPEKANLPQPQETVSGANVFPYLSSQCVGIRLIRPSGGIRQRRTALYFPAFALLTSSPAAALLTVFPAFVLRGTENRSLRSLFSASAGG